MGSKQAVRGAQVGLRIDRTTTTRMSRDRLVSGGILDEWIGREDQPVQNLNQPELEEVGRSDKGATSGSPMGGSGREAG